MNQQFDNHLQVIREAIIAHVPEEQRGNVEAALNEVTVLCYIQRHEFETNVSVLDMLLDTIAQHYKQLSPLLLCRSAIRYCPPEKRHVLVDAYRNWKDAQQET